MTVAGPTIIYLLILHYSPEYSVFFCWTNTKINKLQKTIFFLISARDKKKKQQLLLPNQTTHTNSVYMNIYQKKKMLLFNQDITLCILSLYSLGFHRLFRLVVCHRFSSTQRKGCLHDLSIHQYLHIGNYFSVDLSKKTPTQVRLRQAYSDR